MRDLISRETARLTLKNYGLNRYMLERMERWIDAQPTVDAVSVVHGEWIHNPKIGWGETWVCSICGEKTTSSVMGKPRYKYCPMCGAKMKGEDDEKSY